MKLKSLLIAIGLIGQLSLTAQITNNISIKSTDSTCFFVFINDILQNSTPFYNIKISDYTEKSMKLKILIPDSSRQVIEKSIFFEETLKETSAELIYAQNNYKFRYTGEVAIGVNPIDTNQLIIPFHNSILVLDSLYLKDSTFFTDSLLTNPDISVSYKGTIGCKEPLDDAEPLIENIKAELFSSKKLTLAKKGLTNHCYSINDIKSILSLFEFDDQKLELSFLSYSCAYDLENFYRLKELFLLNSSIDKFEKFLNEN